MADKKSAAPAGDDELMELSFEALLKRLEQVLAELESGRLSLEESLSRFEEGMRLRQLCEKKLRSVELRMEKLVQENGGLAARAIDRDG